MSIWKKALQWAIANYPNASEQHKAAFANSVAYLVTGGNGGSGGPSAREHLVSWSLAGANGRVEAVSFGGQAMTAIYPDGSLPRAGDWEFEAACLHAAPLCFEPAGKYCNILAQIFEREHCFDDDPDDKAALGHR